MQPDQLLPIFLLSPTTKAVVLAEGGRSPTAGQQPDDLSVKTALS